MAIAEYTAAVLADSPWVYYKLDEASGNPQDSSGNGRNIASTDGSYTYQQAGPFSGAFSVLPADSSQFNMGVAAPVNNNNISLEVWLKAAQAVSANDSAICNVGGGSTGFNVQADTNMTFQVLVKAASPQANSVAVLSQAAFKHVVVVLDAGVWKYYVDGAVDTANAGTTTIGNPSDAIIQVAQDFGATYRFYSSLFAYYTTALSAGRVAAHFNAGTQVQATSEVGQYVTHRGGRGAGW